MPATTLPFQAIQHKLKRLRLRFYLVVLWHCLLIWGLLVWLAFIGWLALGQAIWQLVGSGLLLAASYAGYRLYRRPSLSQLASLVDQRCQLQDELVVAWQYRHSGEPVLPLLLARVATDLKRIKSYLIFSFKISRRWWMLVIVLLGGSWYFSHYPLRLPLRRETVEPTKTNHLNVLANQLNEVGQELNRIAPKNKFPQLSKIAERLQQLAQDPEDSATESQVIAQLQELRQELAQSLALPDMPKQAEVENKPALLEVEIKSDWLINLFHKLNQQGISPEQIKNRLLRELVSLMDRLIQFRLPIKGAKSNVSGTQSAKAKAGLDQAKKGESGAPISSVSGVTVAGVGEYAKSDRQGHQPQAIDQSAWRGVGQDWHYPQLAHDELAPKASYSHLPPDYQQQIYSVLADQQIPHYYRQQVRDYFDAINN